MTETTDTPAENAPAKKRAGGLNGMLLPELKQMAGGLGIKGAGGMRKSQLIEAIKAAQSGGQGQGGLEHGVATLGEVFAGLGHERVGDDALAHERMRHRDLHIVDERAQLCLDVGVHGGWFVRREVLVDEADSADEIVESEAKAALDRAFGGGRSLAISGRAPERTQVLRAEQFPCRHPAAADHQRERADEIEDELQPVRNTGDHGGRIAGIPNVHGALVAGVEPVAGREQLAHLTVNGASKVSPPSSTRVRKPNPSAYEIVPG